VPHGIGGAAANSRRSVVVGIAIAVDISEIGHRITRIENALNRHSRFIYSLVPSLLFLLAFRQ
jgi:hypothetical protein